MRKHVLLLFPKTGLDLKRVNLQMPMSLMCLAAPLEELGYRVTILDQRTEKDFFPKVKKLLTDNTVCAGISAMTGMQIHYALAAAKFIRENSRIPIVWGGIHPTLMAEQSIRNNCIDIIVRGEGEITFAKLVQALSCNNSLDKIPGITWKDGAKIRTNAERNFCDLDKLPPTSYDLVNVEKYVTAQVPGKNRSLDIYTSRGCPHSCSFCFNRSFNNSSWRRRDIDKVIFEIEWMVKKFHLDSVNINDDNFFVDIDRSHTFCKRLIDKKIPLAWGCQGVRIDSLEKVDFDLLQRSGCKHLYMGIESGSEKIIQYIRKGITLNQIKNIVHKFSSSGIIAHYNFMVGYPIEAETELHETIELVNYIMRVDPKAYFSSFHIITPYPGTEFYRLSQQHGFTPPQKLEEWSNIRWEYEQVPWIPAHMRKTVFNLTLLTYFIDRKGLDKTKNNLLLRIITKVYMAFAKIHWKHKQFKFCPEFRLLNRLVNYKMSREIRNLASS
ncbi:MAG: radical SAM protein [Candidatus Omnitrophota bacterium]